MKVTPEVPPITNITIHLDDMEAGFLRTNLLDIISKKGKDGFVAELYAQLERYTFPKYEKRHPNWKMDRGIY